MVSSITDFDKKKQLSTTDFNDSGTTEAKAQPVEMAGSDYTGLDGFESGSSQLNWESTSSFSMDGQAVYGEWSLLVSDIGNNTSDSRTLNESISSDGKIARTSLRVDQQSGDTDDQTVFELENSGSRVANVEFQGDGNITTNVGGSETTIASWTTGTVYDIEIILDFTNDQYDVRINGTVEASNQSFVNTASQVDGINIIVNSADGSTNQIQAFFDRLTYTAASEDTTNAGGFIGYDSTVVADEQDVAWFDGNENLRDYEIEDNADVGSSSETFWMWGYGSRTRDGTVQDQIAYGNNSDNNDNQASSSEVVHSQEPGIQVRYGFDESAEPLLDDSGNNYDTDSATVVSNFQVDSDIGFGVELDGVDDYIESTAPVTLFNNETEVTALVHVNLDSFNPNGNGVFLIGQHDGSGSFTDNIYSIWYSGTEFVVNIAGSDRATGVSAPSTNEWHQIALTYDGSNIRLYIDGVEEYSEAETATLTGSNELRLGSGATSNPVPNRLIDGVVSEAKVHNVGKSAEYIQADYDASPRAGQVFFSQQAAETTSQATIDTAQTTTYSITPQTSSETNTRIDNAATTSYTFTPQTSSETNNAVDTAQTTSYVMTPQTSVDFENFTDTAQTTSFVMTPQTTTESQVNVDTAVTTSFSMTPLASNEVQTQLDTAETTTFALTPETSDETNNVTDTAGTTSFVMTPQASTEVQTVIESAETTSYSMTPVNSTEVLVLIDTAETTTYEMTPLTSTESAVTVAPDVNPPLKFTAESMDKYFNTG